MSRAIHTLKAYQIRRSCIAYTATVALWTLDRSEHHWTNSSCRAWTIPKLTTVAHELGQCFGLDHNEDSGDMKLDLMHSTESAYFDWLKDSN